MGSILPGRKPIGLAGPLPPWVIKSACAAENGCVKTIVTSEIGRQIADSFCIHTIVTLTGLNLSVKKLKSLKSLGHAFLLGYEESWLSQHFCPG